MPHDDMRKKALAKAASAMGGDEMMPEEEGMAEAAPEMAGPVPVEEVMTAMETLRAQVAPENMEIFDQALGLLGQALGSGPQQSAGTETMPEEA